MLASVPAGFSVVFPYSYGGKSHNRSASILFKVVMQIQVLIIMRKSATDAAPSVSGIKTLTSRGWGLRGRTGVRRRKESEAMAV